MSKTTKRLKVLDVCAGTGSATQAFRDRGHEVETLDIIGNHTYVCDVREWQPTKEYDFIWCSPPCTCFSVARLRHHWTDHEPNPETIEAIEIVQKCIRIVENNNGLFALENPTGMLRTVDIMKALAKKYFRSTVTYCQYGDTSRKPTDLWHNISGFHPLKCKNGDKCHTSAPRSTRLEGSTQWKSKTDRARIPYGLSLAICKAVEREYA